jgi:hypothetical protein
MREMVGGEQDKLTELQVTMAIVMMIAIAINLFAAVSTPFGCVIFACITVVADSCDATRCSCGYNERHTLGVEDFRRCAAALAGGGHTMMAAMVVADGASISKIMIAVVAAAA